MDGTQLRLIIPNKVPTRHATNAECALVPSWARALQLTAQYSGLEHKQLAAVIPMDEGQLTKTLAGTLGIMPAKLDAFMDACHYDLPGMWWLYQKGYDVDALRKRETELQLRVRELETQLERERAERQVITNFVKEVRA